MRTYPVKSIRDARASERGLSLIEALVVVTITTMMALLLLPMLSRVGVRNFAHVKQAIASADLANAEAEYRSLLASAVQDPQQQFAGAHSSLTFLASASTAAACISAGAPQRVRLSVVNLESGGALVCDGAGRRELLRWPQGSAHFSYNVGSGWLTSWRELPRNGAAPPGFTPPMVRFELDNGEGLWIAAAGWSEPSRVDVGLTQ